MNLGNKISDLRKQKGWSQSELARQINVSREIVGRYERNDAAPSIDIAKRIADAFAVSLDHLVGEGQNARFDKKALQIMQEIDALEPDIKEKLYFLVSAVIRDAKTRIAYKI